MDEEFEIQVGDVAAGITFVATVEDLIFSPFRLLDVSKTTITFALRLVMPNRSCTAALTPESGLGKFGTDNNGISSGRFLTLAVELGHHFFQPFILGVGGFDGYQ
jgi:hypothetical protein